MSLEPGHLEAFILVSAGGKGYASKHKTATMMHPSRRAYVEEAESEVRLLRCHTRLSWIRRA